MEMPNPVNLPPAELGNLPDIEANMRVMSSTTNGRDALAKFIMGEDYISKLIPLVQIAEDFQSLTDLHRLCNIMKTIILLNDTSIIEHAVSDDCVLGVVGALEYDPEFPNHKANHRQWLDNQGRYKEVVPIDDETILRKIHQTYRLQYLKDVVLARILDDPTFSVLNSLIFFNQVDIVQHLQTNAPFLTELFGIFNFVGVDQKRKKDAVLFIQQCCAIAKNLQPPARQNLYGNFIHHGLLGVINFGLRHSDVGVRVGATDILVSMIDHDPQMIRGTIYRQLHEKEPPLTDSLVDLLLVEVDLGVKSQVSDALKVLLDQGPPVQAQDVFVKANGEFQGRARPQQSADPQQDILLASFYEHSAARLFRPLRELEARKDMRFEVQEASMFSYLIEILSFFIRQHHHRSKFFVLQNNIHVRVVQLLSCPEKYLRLGEFSNIKPRDEMRAIANLELPVAIRFIRHLVGLQDEFYVKQIVEKRLLGPILEVLIETVPRDNLLGSACLDLFELIKKENIKDLVKHLVESYRDRLSVVSHIEVFKDILLRYDQTRGYTMNMDAYLFEPDEDVARRPANAHGRPGTGVGGLMEHMADAADDDYWNTSDDEDEQQAKNVAAAAVARGVAQTNGVTTPGKLVDYASDEEGDDDVAVQDAKEPQAATPDQATTLVVASTSTSPTAPPPERVSEKRRREEDEEEDMLGKMVHSKRRNSSSASSNPSPTSGILRRKKSLSNAKDAATSAAGSGSGAGGVAAAAGKKIAISITQAGKKTAHATAAAAGVSSSSHEEDA